MKTDKDEVKEFLNQFNIGFEIKDNGNIYIKEGMKNVGGYMWFYTVFEFDKDGKFIEIGAYE